MTKPGPYRFLGRALLFLLPVLLLLSLAEAILLRGREIWPVDQVLAYQANHPDALFLRRFMTQELQRYKYRGILANNPDIVVLGSSRVMRLRALMFGPHANVYNAGGILQAAGDLEELAKRLPEASLPRVALIGVDEWWLSGRYVPGAAPLAEALEREPTRDWQAHLHAIRNLVRYASAHSRFVTNAMRGVPPDVIGWAATTGNAFRADGSLHDTYEVPTTAEEWVFRDREEPRVAERIDRSLLQFVRTNHVSMEALASLRRGFAMLRRRGVAVIAYLPPMCRDIRTKLRSDPDWAMFLDELDVALPRSLRRRRIQDAEIRRPEAGQGRPISATHAPPSASPQTIVAWLPADQAPLWFDFRATESLGLDDRYLVDCLHAVETFHVHMLRRMTADPRVRELLGELETTADALLAAPKTNFWHVDVEGAAAAADAPFDEIGEPQR